MSKSDYAFLSSQFPEFRDMARSDQELEDLLDAWFAHDHYADNPVYTWSDAEDGQ
jgi:hypothetical protein